MGNNGSNKITLVKISGSDDKILAEMMKCLASNGFVFINNKAPKIIYSESSNQWVVFARFYTPSKKPIIDESLATLPEGIEEEALNS